MIRIFTWKDTHVFIPVVGDTHDIVAMDIEGMVDLSALERLSLTTGMLLISLLPLEDTWAVAVLYPGKTEILQRDRSWANLVGLFASTCSSYNLFSDVAYEHLASWVYTMVVYHGINEPLADYA